MPTPDTFKIAGLIDLFPPSTTIGKVLLLTGVPSSGTASISTWLTYEVGSYQGTSGRQDAITPASGSYAINGFRAECIVSVIFDNTSGAADITYQQAGLFTSDLSELIALAHTGYVQNLSIPAGESIQINFRLRFK